MGISDAFRKSKQEEKGHTTPPPSGHTLIEILNDKRKSDLLGKLLEKEGGNEGLMQRLALGELEADDIKVLEQKRSDLSEKITSAEKIEGLLSTESIVEFARSHPKFEEIINLLGPEKAAKVIRGQLAEMSITDESRFDDIARAVRTLESYKKGEYKKVNDKVEKLCKDSGINLEKYLEVLKLKDSTEKTKALKELAKEHGGKWFNRLNKELLKSLEAAEGSMEVSFGALDALNEKIGGALFLSVHENAGVRKALSQELAGAKAKAEKKNGFADAKKGHEQFSDEEYKKDWEAFKKKSGYDKEDAFGQETIKDMFTEEQQEKYKEKNEENEGFWASVFSALFERKIKDKKATLK